MLASHHPPRHATEPPLAKHGQKTYRGPWQHHPMHFPPISVSLLFIIIFSLGLIFSFYIFRGDKQGAEGGVVGGWGGTGVELSQCLCDASDGASAATCSLWPPPHPLTSSSSSSTMFLDTLHRPLAPHSICASCLPPAGLQYERALDKRWLSTRAAAQTGIPYCQ